MNIEIYNKYKSTAGYYNRQYKDQAMMVAGKNKTFCSCGTIDCQNRSYKEHDMTDMWVPNDSFMLPNFFDKIFPYHDANHRYRAINQPSRSDVAKEIAKFPHDARYILLDEFLTKKYQKKLIARRPAKYRDTWSAGLGTNYMKALLEFLDFAFDKDDKDKRRILKNIVLKKLKGK